MTINGDDSAGPDRTDDLEGLLQLAGPRDMPDAIGRSVARAAVRDEWRAAVRARTRRRWVLVGVPALAAAAILVIAILPRWRTPAPVAIDSVVAHVTTGGAVLRVRRGPALHSPAGGEALRAGDILESPAGSVAAVTLIGGGEIRLNSGTSVRLVQVRQIALDEGHIYVDAGTGAHAPITIATPVGPVRDIGTRFDVRVHKGEARIRVRDGLVRLETSAASHDVGAGYGLVAGTGGNIVQGAVDTFGDDWDWVLRATSFRLERASMAAFITWIEEESGRQVEFRPASLRREAASTVLHGSVAGLSLSEALDTILPAAALTYRIEGARIVILRPASEPRR